MRGTSIRRRGLLGLALCLALGCGAPEKVAGMVEKQQALSSSLSEQLGANVEVGWKWHNGRLANVTVQIPADQVRDRSAGELTDAVVEWVKTMFETTPDAVVLWLMATPGDG